MKQFSNVSALAVALVAAGLMAVPVAQGAGACVDSVTAGGWIPDGGANEFANFGLNAKNSSGDLSGSLNFVDADEECHVVSTDIVSYSGTGDCREIVYDVTVNGVAGFTATVLVCDNGEPGTSDTFSIGVTDAEGLPVETCSASGTLAGGDVQVHVYGNCP